MTPTVLLVDDQPAFLMLCARLLRRVNESTALDVPTVTVRTARSGDEALPILQDDPSCALVISDLRMPGLDGLAFLDRARALRPDVVRMLLSAEADFQVAVDAINRGLIFRLLTKPPEFRTFRRAVTDGLEQHRLLTAERQLLEQTLMGSVRLLVDILRLLDPVGSSRAFRIHRYVQHMARTLAIPDAWQLEVAAMLSHIGALTLSHEDRGVPADRSAHGITARALLEQIPRLESVAGMIANQDAPVDPFDQRLPMSGRDPIRRGGQLLKIAMAFDRSILSGGGREQTLAALRARPGEFDPMLVEGLRTADLRSESLEPRRERLGDLAEGMMLDEDLRNEAGVLILPRGQELTLPMLLRLQALTPQQDRHKRVRVLAPRVTGLSPPPPTISWGGGE